MKLAFVLYKYFPYGGLQRDFLRIAELCHKRGHQIDVYCMNWSGEKPDWLNLVMIPVRALTKVGQYQQFDEGFQEALKAGDYAAVIGFNKMPGLDVYFSGDPCYEDKSTHRRPWWYKYTPRYRHFSRYERVIFQPGAKTHILQISRIQQALFEKYYGTEPERVTIMPPGINKNRLPGEDAEQVRKIFRSEFGLADDDLLMVQIGSGFRTKGVDRSIKALASLPVTIRRRTRLFVIGEDSPKEYRVLAKALGVDLRITFLSGRDDVPRFLQGADLLIHPAYAEAAGTVILEAVVAGLPALVTDVCGYAEYVSLANSGVVLPSPFEQSNLNYTLCEMLVADKSNWRKNGIAFSKTADIYSLHTVAADVIERAAQDKHKGLQA